LFFEFVCKSFLFCDRVLHMNRRGLRPLADNNTAQSMAVPLSEEYIGMCHQAFAKFDRDGSGAISTHDLRQTLAGAHRACSPAATPAKQGIL
jgi:hypothetical protein